MKKRLLAKFPVYSRLDELDLQIRFEWWIKQYPHIGELYEKNRLLIEVDEHSNFVIEVKMSNKEYLLWLLAHPETPLITEIYNI